MRKLFIFIILVAIVAGVVWYWSRPAQAPENDQIATPTPEPTASPGAIPAAPEPKSVSIVDFSFVPATYTVKRGDKVIFINKDTVPHNAVAAGKFDSGILQKEQTYLLDTTTLPVGTYPYICTLHPSMRGTLIIQ